MGSTGHSSGPHLHFEVHPDGRLAVDPISSLPGTIAGKILTTHYRDTIATHY